MVVSVKNTRGDKSRNVNRVVLSRRRRQGGPRRALNLPGHHAGAWDDVRVDHLDVNALVVDAPQRHRRPARRLVEEPRHAEVAQLALQRGRQHEIARLDWKGGRVQIQTAKKNT